LKVIDNFGEQYGKLLPETLGASAAADEMNQILKFRQAILGPLSKTAGCIFMWFAYDGC
jgi:hypothetical protein